jgi:small nuclear ribonucleoprotein F
MQSIVNPKPFLTDLTGQAVLVKLKWGMEYRGILLAIDSYMNLQVSILNYLILRLQRYNLIIGSRMLFLQLADTEEFIDGQLSGNLGEVLIRCNNVLYISAAPST